MKISIASSIKYGNYTQYRERACEIVVSLHRLHNLFNEHFDFGEGVNVAIRPIRGKGIRGRAIAQTKTIEIDPRFNLKSIIETIAHELTHIEQFKQGRFAIAKYEYTWFGKPVKPPKSYKQYFDSPWEVEARERASKFIRLLKLMSLLE